MRMTMTIEEILIMIKRFIEEPYERNKYLNQQLSVLDKKQNEVLHYLENHEKLDTRSRNKIIMLLQNIRHKRREVKNEIEIISCLRDNFLDKQKNKMTVRDIEITLKAIRGKRNIQENPVFKYQYLTEELNIIEEEEDKDYKDTFIMQEQKEQSTDND